MNKVDPARVCVNNDCHILSFGTVLSVYWQAVVDLSPVTGIINDMVSLQHCEKCRGQDAHSHRTKPVRINSR
jgi:hypothetical protein